MTICLSSTYFQSCCCCLGKALIAQLFKKRAWLLHLICGKVQPTRTLKRLGWCLSSSQSLSVVVFHPGRSHGCCPVRATVGLITKRALTSDAHSLAGRGSVDVPRMRGLAVSSVPGVPLWRCGTRTLVEIDNSKVC